MIQPDVFTDDRGDFSESWNSSEYRALGIDFDFVQMNRSRSKRGTIRGLHFQFPDEQGKLVMCVQGRVMDYAVDIRRGSQTFGKYECAELSGKNQHQLWIPSGFAHGFEVLSAEAVFVYLVTAQFRKEHDRAVRFDDPDIHIPWRSSQPIVSEKDRNAPLLREIGELPQKI